MRSIEELCRPPLRNIPDGTDGGTIWFGPQSMKAVQSLKGYNNVKLDGSDLIVMEFHGGHFRARPGDVVLVSRLGRLSVMEGWHEWKKERLS